MMRILGVTALAAFTAACSLHPSPGLDSAKKIVSTPAGHAAAAAAYRQKAHVLRAKSAEQERQARRLAGAAGGTLIGTDSNLYVAADYCRRTAAYLAGVAARAEESARAHDHLAGNGPSR